jgi:hypothetical protein
VPDLFAHFASGYLPTRFSRLRHFDALIVLGAVLPDLTTRIPEIIFDRFFGLPVFHFFNALHTPVGVALTCYALAFAFEENERKNAFWCLFIGSILHITLDLLQKQFHDAVYMPLFPFSFATVQWGLFHFNASVAIFPVIFLGVLISWLCTKTR